MTKNVLQSATAALLMLAVSTSAFGAGTSDGKISTINAGGGFVYVKGTMTGPAGHGCASNNFYVLQSTNSAYKDVYAAILTSYATGQTLALNVVGCVTPGTTSFPNITSVIMK